MYEIVQKKRRKEKKTNERKQKHFLKYLTCKKKKDYINKD